MIGITQAFPGGDFSRNITPRATYADVDDATCTARGWALHWPGADFSAAEFNDDTGELVDLLTSSKRNPCQMR